MEQNIEKMKTTIEKQEKGKKLYEELVQKAWKSASFKNQLINDPNKIIEQEFGFKNEENIVVEDQTDSNFIYLNIPQKLDLENIELTDEQLEGVSGGDITLGTVVTWVALTALGGALWDMSGGVYRRVKEELE